MPAPLTTSKQALALLKRRGIVPLTAVPGLVSLVEAVAGEAVRGSWWGHPKGGAIFRIASELEDDPEALVVKLVAGKIAYVHAALWPALYRVVSDEAWRAPRMARLDAAAKRLAAEVEAKGTMRPGDRKSAELERTLLVLATQVHSESGRHVTELRSWSSWAKPEVVAAARALTLEQALAAVRERAAGAPIALDAAHRLPKMKRRGAAR